MHCLGAVPSGSASPQRAGNCGSVLGVVRALGVLVSEGRVQGPPRGYKEGPHCAAPLQPAPNNHVCEKDNYLCDRYVILVREIADIITTRSYLCVEVLLCTDCPCGLAKATCKNPVSPMPSMSIVPWQQSSEMLLEYWCISVVPSKGPEMMNNQSLYQAVRSRLHFSQVAAWWSRSKGSDPSYITTRVVSYSEDNLRKFRETPSEHTFPLAACGDGNSIKVTVWALPRVEDVPILNCPIHPISEKEEEGAARALTPTKNAPVPATSANIETLVLPILVDDRLHTPCNEPGKHHCRCEEEDGCPPSPSVRSNGERKRRRSLPRGPDYIPSVTPHTSTNSTSVLPSVCELAAREVNRGLDSVGVNNIEARYSPSGGGGGGNCLNSDTDCSFNQVQIRSQTLLDFGDKQSDKERINFNDNHQINENGFENGDASIGNLFSLSGCLLDEESNVEKRYKCSVVAAPRSVISDKSSCDNKKPYYYSRRERSPKFNRKDYFLRWHDHDPNPVNGGIIFGDNCTPETEQSSSLNTVPKVSDFANPDIDWITGRISGIETESGEKNKKDKLQLGHIPINDTLPIIHSKANFVVNPFSESSPFHESNPGPSTYICNDRFRLLTSYFRDEKNIAGESLVQNGADHESVTNTEDRNSNNDLSQLMSKLKFPDESEKTKDEKGILDWISKVPSRVFNVAAASNGFADQKSRTNREMKLDERNGLAEVKTKQNCNLELSQREFDEVLAVLRARTPAGRRRAPMRTIKRRDKFDKQNEESINEQKSEAKDKTMASNSNPSYYPTHNNPRNKTVIADRLGIAKLHGKIKDQGVNNNSEKSEPVELCKNVKKISVHNQKSFRHQSMQRALSIGEGKIFNGDNNHCEKIHNQGNKSDERFCNETSKADVLLGAILRTSKDPRKGLADISNGARPRTAVESLSDEDCAGKKSLALLRDAAEKPEPNHTLPSSLNKRITQLKQLFKKEVDNTDCETSNPVREYVIVSSDKSGNISNICPRREAAKSLFKNSKETRVKRRIDFSNFNESGNPFVSDKNSSVADLHRGRIGPSDGHQNPLFQGINYNNTENSFPERIRGQLLAAGNSVIDGEEGRYSHSKNSSKHSKNLKLQIWEKGNGNICNNRDSDFPGEGDSQPRQSQDPENKDLQEYQNAGEFEGNDTSERIVPSVIEQERFRRSLGNAASMVFHSRTGLPLTSSPAPLRRGSCCFDYDSSLNSVSSKRSALFELNTPPSPGAVSLEEGDRETENNYEGEEILKRRTPSRGLPHSHALLGSFEESALNGRLEPVSTVHGFTAELGASGSFCPKHRKLPVTVFFYTLGDNDKVSTPYLAHINLGKKGYQVPRSGTIQVTLLNPLGTVVKMFVVMYDLSDMPARSHTFLRQRTLRDKTLRYLIHLRFMSGKSGRIYLHTDIRMIICRKSDVDTASDLGAEPPKELRSFVHGPTNPKFSPRC